MKPILFAFISLLYVWSASAQSEMKAMFLKAEDYYKNKKLDSALIIYKVITQKFPDSLAYSRAFYNVGYTAWELNLYDEAIPVFKKILKSNFDDNETGPGSGIMSERYALYKYRASSILSEIYLEQKNFDSALFYLKLSEKYPYKHFCGNEYAANDIYVAVQYSRCYEGLGKINKAINVLWKHVFYYEIANNRGVIEQMKIVLPKKYTHAQIQQELWNALKTVYIKKQGRNAVGYIRLFKNKILLPEWIDMKWSGTIDYLAYSKLKGIELYRANYLYSDFYREFVQ